MTAKKALKKIHLCLGLASGLLILFLGITGCILAFETETRKLTENFRKVEDKGEEWLLPSQLKPIAEKQMQSGKVIGIEYPGREKAAIASYYDENNYEIVFINPYSGEVIKHKNMKHDFFRIVLEGHYNLWMPHDIGQMIVCSGTLVFVILMITGIILWWPKNKSARKQRFSIKWNASFKRKNYDLHNVLGFYMTWVAIFIAITGMAFGFKWVSQTIYFVSSGGEKMIEHKHPHSYPLNQNQIQNLPDLLWMKYVHGIAGNESIGIYFAQLPDDPHEVVINHRPGTYYKSDYFHFDQYSGKLLHAEGSYDGKFSEASIANKIVRMNYDMHVGAIFGLPGKILAFLASLIAASLPVTGFLIWRGKQKKKKAGLVQETREPIAYPLDEQSQVCLQS